MQAPQHRLWSNLLVATGGISGLYLAVTYFYRFRNAYAFSPNPPYQWLLLSMTFSLITGFCYGVKAFSASSELQLHIDWKVLIIYSSPSLLLFLGTLALITLRGFRFDQMLFMDTQSLFTGPGSLAFMLQPLLSPLWVGIAIGKALR